MSKQTQHDKKMKQGKEQAEQTIQKAYELTKKEQEARLRAAEGIGYF